MMVHVLREMGLKDCLRERMKIFEDLRQLVDTGPRARPGILSGFLRVDPFGGSPHISCFKNQCICLPGHIRTYGMFYVGYIETSIEVVEVIWE